MHKLVTVLILAMALPIVFKTVVAAENTPEVLVAEPNGVTEPKAVPSPSPEALPPGTNSEAFDICLRATQRFEQQEKAKLNGSGKIPVTSLSASCKTELKPASYWLCMDKEAKGEVDFNTAHWRCAKQTKLLN
ncbi:MAG: hypothetical protein IPN42_10960 [Methylococcaceae bacterium]|nr:hypothetical protein [Methylococcaceae bacterium]